MKNQQHQHLKRLSVLSLAVAGAALCGTASAVDQSPKMTYEIPMPKDAFFSPLGKKTEGEYNQFIHLMLDPDNIFKPDQRQATLKTAKPLLLGFESDYGQLATQFPSMKKGLDPVHEQTVQRLALLGDEDTVKSLNDDAAGTDKSKSIRANCILIDNAWTMAQGDQQKQTALADKLEKLCHDHPDSDALTTVCLKLANVNTVTAMHDRMTDLALDGMNNPTAKKFATIKKIHDVSKEMATNVGKPFVLTGKTTDGKDFTTADWKGKVVMIDFWATWCAPCKAQLPTIEKLYADNHAKGFEIVSVSNDFDLNTLKKYTAEHNMPWPELFDPAAASKKTWNPTTLNNGIDGIPHAFVIDRGGNLITSNAGKNYKTIVEQALAGPV